MGGGEIRGRNRSTSLTTIAVVVGTRPEVIKMAPVISAFARRGVRVRLIVTSQHSDHAMMGAFLEQFGLAVDHQLTRPSGDMLESLTAILQGLGDVLRREAADLVLAVGDTTTVLASALAARKLGAAFGHVEAGLRAFSRELPEEEHRICADVLADLLFAPTRIAVENLSRERVNGRVLLTGNTVLDALRETAPRRVADAAREGALVTLHRQETVDDPDRLAGVLSALERIGMRVPVIWPLHPRTVDRMRQFGLALPPTVQALPPCGHRAFLDLLAKSRVVITDSGGVQEEAAILGTPCVIAREHTERLETIAADVGLLSGLEPDAIVAAVDEILTEWPRFGRAVPHIYGNGRAGDAIADASLAYLDELAGEVSVREGAL